MKLLLIHFLIASTFLVGCAPVGPPSNRGTVSYPVSQKAPQAPKLKRLPNGHYRVRKPWTVELNGRRWTVPAGYSTNGITAPDQLKKSLGDGVEHPETWSAIFHDWLFTQPGITRDQADSTFYDLMLAYGVPANRAKVMYSTVKLYSISKSFR